MTPDEKIYALRLLIAASRVVRSMPKIDGAINWGDLDCVAVERVQTIDAAGNVASKWRVLIEEAAHDAVKLHEAVAGRLRASGFEAEVATGW